MYLEFSEIVRNKEILDCLKNDWMKFSPGLTEISIADVEKISLMSLSYCNELIDKLRLRFLRPEILTVVPE